MDIASFNTVGKAQPCLSEIAALLNRHSSSISRKLKRHSKDGNYSPSAAHAAKPHSGRKRKLEVDSEWSQTVKRLFLDYQWLPEKIAGSINQLSNAIYRGYFDDTDFMVIEKLSANFVIVRRLVIPRTMLKNVKKLLSHIRFIKDRKKDNFVLG